MLQTQIQNQSSQFIFSFINQSKDLTKYDLFAPNFKVSPFSIFGEGFTLELYCCGCPFFYQNKPCPECHNTELQIFDSNVGKWFSVDEMVSIVYNYLQSGVISEIHFYGGDPLFSKERAIFLSKVCKQIKEKFPNVLLVIFTGYSLKKLPDYVSYLLPYIDYLKCGRYVKDLPPVKITEFFELASSNQRIYKIENGEIVGEIRNGQFKSKEVLA